MPRYRQPDRSAVIGARICIARLSAGLSQVEVARRLDMSFQQYQKYERGRSQLPAVMLDDLGALLGRPVLYFLATDDVALGRLQLLEMPSEPRKRRQMIRAITVLKAEGHGPSQAGVQPSHDDRVSA